MEICCCRDPLSEFSCSTSDFCGNKSSLQLAKPQDLQIVCNLRSQEAVPQGIAYQEATVLDILQIKDHPSYVLLEQQGTVNQGPINGCDFSIYFVDDSKLAARMNPNTIWPACLPRADEDYMPGNKGILAGWSDPLPTSVSGSANLLSYTNQYYLSREALFERQPLCSDPTWMKSNTYYPPNTVCYTEAAWAGSVQFGMSGSGLVRPFTSADNQQTRYSLVGPLSLSKGSDRGVLSDYSGLVDYSSNPAIITDVRCYMDWIAEQYGLRLPPGFTIPTSCWTPSGDRNSANNTQCLSRAIRFNETSNKPERCRFTPGFDKCCLFSYDPMAKPNFNLNFYYCLNVNNEMAACANDCPGVDPNAVVVGGEAALLSLAVAASVGPDLLGPVLGAGVGLAGLGLGGVAMNRRPGLAACPAGQCRARFSRRCCNLLVNNGQQVCPLAC